MPTGSFNTVAVKSSLSLQIIVFYQSMSANDLRHACWITHNQTRFSVLYFVICGGCLLNKIHNYHFHNGILEILTLPIFLLWSFTEVARVVLGYVGNVNERVPMISAFLLLTIFPQLAAVFFFATCQDPVKLSLLTSI